MIEPEYITIVEGPTPEFQTTPDFAFNSILEGPQDAFTAYCELRTMNGEAIRDRCRNAWKQRRPVRLDFPDEMRMRKELDVVGLRLNEVDEGTVLQLWVRHPVTAEDIEEIDLEDFADLDDFDELDDFDDLDDVDDDEDNGLSFG